MVTKLISHNRKVCCFFRLSEQCEKGSTYSCSSCLTHTLAVFASRCWNCRFLDSHVDAVWCMPSAGVSGFGVHQGNLYLALVIGSIVCDYFTLTVPLYSFLLVQFLYILFYYAHLQSCKAHTKIALLSIHTHVKTWEQLNRFSQNFILGSFTKTIHSSFG